MFEKSAQQTFSRKKTNQKKNVKFDEGLPLKWNILYLK